MTDSLNIQQFQARLQRLDALLREVERRSDPTAQAHTRELVQLVLEHHAADLDRLLDRVAEAGES